MNKERRSNAGVKVAVLLAALGTAAGNASAGGQTKSAWYRVTVQATSQMDIPQELLKEGQDSATTIFAAIHVQLIWSGQVPSSSQTSPCVDESATSNLVLQIVPHAPANVSNVALAMAMPHANSGVRLIVFYERVDPLLRSHHAPQGKVLGYVLAHEIAHVLQGISRHSDVGIMRPRWTDNDFRQMGIGALTFTNEDVRLIRRRFEVQATSAAC